MEEAKKSLEKTIKNMGFESEKRKKEKQDFLLMINKENPTKTTKLYMSVLKNVIDAAEKKNNREWMDFTPEMVDTTFVEIQSTSKIALQSYLSIIKHYLSATTPQSDDVKRGHRYTMDLTKDDLSQYINTIGERYKYVSPDEFDEIIHNRPLDPLCKSLLILLYLGVKGNRFSEICSIMDRDIDLETGVIKVDHKVLCVIPEPYIKYFKQAMEAEEYYRYDADGKKSTTSKINTASKYFLKRRINYNNDEFAAPDSNLVSNTLGDAKNSIKNPYITPISIYLSGEAYRLIERCNMQMPTNQDLKAFREETGSTLSFVSMKTVCSIILDKLSIETP